MPTVDELDDADETKLAEIQTVVDGAGLQPHPVADDRCLTCEYYLEPERRFAYCWHPSLRILVSADWWCQWFEERSE
jgi:hypothetical protein